MLQAVEGAFSSGVPYLRAGQGPPLLMASGLTSEHANPTGRWRTQALSYVAPFAEHFTVYLANRRPGLPRGASISDIAADYVAKQPADTHINKSDLDPQRDFTIAVKGPANP